MTDIMTLNSPEDWKLVRLGQLFRERKEKGSDKDFPALSVTMKGIVPQLETAAKTDDGDNRKIVRVGDYVINSRSDRKGSGGISSFEGSVSQISIVLEPKNIHPPFAHHLLRSAAFQEEFYRWGHGIVADLWSTRYGDMKNIRLRVPDLATQRRIADFLDRETARIDRAIEKKQRLVELIDEKRASLITAVVTGQLAPKADQHGLSRELVEKSGGEGQRVRFMKLRHVADIRNSNVDKVVVKGELPIRLCNYVDVYKNDFIEATMDFSAGSATRAEIKAFGLREGDVIITKDSEDRNDIGVPALVRSAAPDLVCGYHLSLLRAKEGVAIGLFLFWALLSKPARDAFSNAAYGITRFGMTLGSIKNVVVPLPDLATQRRIADFLDRETAILDSLKTKTNESIIRLKEYRAALITAAVTGQIDVEEYARSGATERRLDAIEQEAGA